MAVLIRSTFLLLGAYIILMATDYANCICPPSFTSKECRDNRNGGDFRRTLIEKLLDRRESLDTEILERALQLLLEERVEGESDDPVKDDPAEDDPQNPQQTRDWQWQTEDKQSDNLEEELRTVLRVLKGRAIPH